MCVKSDGFFINIIVTTILHAGKLLSSLFPCLSVYFIGHKYYPKTSRQLCASALSSCSGILFFLSPHPSISPGSIFLPSQDIDTQISTVVKNKTNKKCLHSVPLYSSRLSSLFLFFKVKFLERGTIFPALTFTSFNPKLVSIKTLLFMN